MSDLVQASIASLGGLGSFFISQTIANVNAVLTGFMGGNKAVIEALFPLAILVLQFYILLATLKVLHMIWILLHGVHFFQRRPKSYSVRREGGKRILIIGDSTAYGTGAEKPEDTIAGRLGRDFPRTEIINTAVNGSLTREAIPQLQSDLGTFDLIIISTGGNDIWHFTPLASLERDITHLLEEALKKSEHKVILFFYANLGDAPIFPSGIRSLLGKRARQVHDVFARVAASLQVPLIELYTGKEVHKFTPNPFLAEPEKYYAKDRMHPSSEGYRLWYNYMWSEMVARGFVFHE